MNILKNKKILRGLGQQIDMVNTLGGGVAMAQIAVKPKQDWIEVTVAAPSVKPQHIQVLVEYNRLIIVGTIPAHTEGGQAGLNIPLFSRILEIPFHVDAENIRAVYQNGLLKVIMPYAKGRTKVPRAIDIEVLD